MKTRIYATPAVKGLKTHTGGLNDCDVVCHTSYIYLTTDTLSLGS